MTTITRALALLPALHMISTVSDPARNYSRRQAQLLRPVPSVSVFDLSSVLPVFLFLSLITLSHPSVTCCLFLSLVCPLSQRFRLHDFRCYVLLYWRFARSWFICMPVCSHHLRAALSYSFPYILTIRRSRCSPVFNTLLIYSPLSPWEQITSEGRSLFMTPGILARNSIPFISFSFSRAVALVRHVNLFCSSSQHVVPAFSLTSASVPALRARILCRLSMLAPPALPSSPRLAARQRWRWNGVVESVSIGVVRRPRLVFTMVICVIPLIEEHS